ncbi:MAG: 3-dehydroquinate synthase [Candidatus Gastranaerophilales bacterium]|nr:3-dehydroquinate synthase [Candidatus Gastranaerophilales bacterium]
MCLDELIIKSNIKDYCVSFESNGDFIKELTNIENTVFVIDKKVWNLHKNSLLAPIKDSNYILQEAKEDKKNIKSVCKLYEKIMQSAPRKNMTLISIGGGIIQDITGFVASSLYRGINWIFIPTTLLAQVDSCIGAKTSLNFKHYKNLVGTFYPPSKIYIYPNILHTLKKADYYSGIGEMAKLNLMEGEISSQNFVKNLSQIDKQQPDILLKEIKHCLKIKKSYIENDEFDTGKRNLLNFGHCFGHAIESSTDFAISHGQAVVLGMILANKYSLKQNKLTEEKEKWILNNILSPILTTNIKKLKINSKKTIQAMKQDKKNIGKGLALVLLENDFNLLKITNLKQEEAQNLIEDYIKEIQNGKN